MKPVLSCMGFVRSEVPQPLPAQAVGLPSRLQHPAASMTWSAGSTSARPAPCSDRGGFRASPCPTIRPILRPAARSRLSSSSLRAFSMISASNLLRQNSFQVFSWSKTTWTEQGVVKHGFMTETIPGRRFQSAGRQSRCDRRRRGGGDAAPGRGGGVGSVFSFFFCRSGGAAAGR